jgi:hypothetical protein
MERMAFRDTKVWPVVEVTVTWVFASVMLSTGVPKWMWPGPIREARWVARDWEPGSVCGQYSGAPRKAEIRIVTGCKQQVPTYPPGTSNAVRHWHHPPESQGVPDSVYSNQ